MPFYHKVNHICRDLLGLTNNEYALMACISIRKDVCMDKKKYLAEYIGVTEVTLHRMKKKLLKSGHIFEVYGGLKNIPCFDALHNSEPETIEKIVNTNEVLVYLQNVSTNEMLVDTLTKCKSGTNEMLVEHLQNVSTYNKNKKNSIIRDISTTIKENENENLESDFDNSHNSDINGNTSNLHLVEKTEKEKICAKKEKYENDNNELQTYELTISDTEQADCETLQLSDEFEQENGLVWSNYNHERDLRTVGKKLAQKIDEIREYNGAQKLCVFPSNLNREIKTCCQLYTNAREMLLNSGKIPENGSERKVFEYLEILLNFHAENNDWQRNTGYKFFTSTHFNKYLFERHQEATEYIERYQYAQAVSDSFKKRS